MTRKINAREILADIRSGMDQPALTEKRGCLRSSYKMSSTVLQANTNSRAKAIASRSDKGRFGPGGDENTPDLQLLFC